jgi:TMEM141 protein family
MSSIRSLKDRYRSDHPGIENYLDCMVRSRFTGLSAFALGLFERRLFVIVIYSRNNKHAISLSSTHNIGFSIVYFSQKLVHKHLPLKLQTTIFISLGVGIAASYKISSDRSLACQKAWLAAEDKHTALTSLDDTTE